MDVLSEILRSIRFESSVFFRANLSGPWGMTLNAATEPRFHIVLRGACWLQTADMDEPLKLVAGDIAILPQGESHWMADDPASERIDSTDVVEAYERGMPLFQGHEVATQLLCGLFRFEQDVAHPLLNVLPSPLHVMSAGAPEETGMLHTLRLIEQEQGGEGPGSVVLVDRLCEILFIQALRVHQTLESYSHGMLAALEDPIVGPALQRIHTTPQALWTLDQMASEVGASRAVFADRFSRLVGMPPKAYLTAWRMQKARRLLQDSQASLFDIATAVGYRSDTAFQKAFKRCFGVSPAALRKQQSVAQRTTHFSV